MVQVPPAHMVLFTPSTLKHQPFGFFFPVALVGAVAALWVSVARGFVRAVRDRVVPEQGCLPDQNVVRGGHLSQYAGGW